MMDDKDDKKYLADMPLQEAAINLLATGYSVKEAAAILRVEPSTIRHWWGADMQFRPTVDALRQQSARAAGIQGDGDMAKESWS